MRARLGELGHDEAAKTVVIRNISTLDRTFYVPNAVQRHFTSAEDGGAIPEALTYRSKAIAMFQRQDGTDICLFCMYVQEYGDGDVKGSLSSSTSSSHPHNRRMVYISYLDSVEYFRPRTADSSARTAVYHEIIVSYLAWVRRRGFVRAHLWACPPQRGNNFIFWCHPQHQRTPSKERLIQWYRSMVAVAQRRGVVTKVANFYEEYFASTCGPAPLVPTAASKNPARAAAAAEKAALRLQAAEQQRQQKDAASSAASSSSPTGFAHLSGAAAASA